MAALGQAASSPVVMEPLSALTWADQLSLSRPRALANLAFEVPTLLVEP